MHDSPAALRRGRAPGRALDRAHPRTASRIGVHQMASASTGDGSPRQLVVFAVSSLLIFGYLACSLFYTLPSNALSSRHSKGARPALNILTPENWAFFTRNPETVQNGIYAVASDGTIRNLLHTPQGLPSNIFGLSRKQRAQGPELGYLNASAAHSWTACSGVLTECVKKASARAPHTLRNSSPVPTVCGDSYLTQEQTVPWSFRHEVPYTKRVVEVAHLDVQCD
ncbi:SdpA family antimicrobial peptide system protein [Streptomyces sp. YS-3]|uniref:SdpA family antimicrobial peptide system protein n=1 Tax=Streptomyces sp. YS-3 TaxID=3381352 RepID=UPI0038626836